ncbi:LuxR C-terminal-related transcriptional regulator [Actinoalloteichus sp. AHMU CJ021]|uniref:LuxR C-terminal-related transcriptional regulator n=1 Tax=Actinoalloteichus sp. AHMU CJ021 TaxID=2072503 RepID=UPI0026D34113
MELLERHAESAALRRAYHDGGGAVVLVSSCVGGGKTGLLQSFGEYVASAGGVVVSVVGSRAERTFGFGVLEQVVASPSLSSQVRCRLRDLLDRAIGGGAAPQGGESAAVEVFVDALGGALADLASEQGITLCVDDVHFVDEVSLRCLLSVQRRMVAAGGVVVFGETPQLAVTHSQVHAELMDQPRYQWIRLSRLSRPGVAAAVTRRLGDTPPPVVEACCEATGGNPRLVRAALDDHAAAEEHSELVVGLTFRHAVLACLCRLDSRVLEVARGIAVLGEQATPDRLVKLLGLKAGVVRRSVELIAAIGLVRTDRFRHPAVREAVLGTLPPEDHTRLASRAAWVLHQDGADATSVVRHLLAAEQAEQTWMIGVLQDSARQALADGNAGTAVRCLDLASRGIVGDRERAENTARLAAAEWRMNPSAAASHLGTLTQAMRDGLLDQREIVALIKYRLWFGEVDQAADVVARLVAGGTLLDWPLVAELRIAHQVSHFGKSPMWDLLDKVGPGPVDNEVVTGSAQMAVRLMTLLLTNGSQKQVVTAAEQILLNSQVDESSFESVVCALQALIQVDRPGKALDWSTRLLDLPIIRGASTWRAVLSAISTHAAVRCGKPPRATALATSMFATLPVHSWGLTVGLPLSDLLHVATAQGATAEAEQVLRQVVPERMLSTWSGLRYLRARGHYYLAHNRVYAALEDFRRCGDMMTAEGVDIPAVIPWRADIAQAYLRLDLREKAKKLVEQQLALPGASSARVRGASLRVLALTSEPPQRRKLLEKAVNLLRESGDQVELSMALSDLHTTGHRPNQPSVPALLGRGTSKAPVIDLPRHDRVSTLPRGEQLLSSAERRVADLVALGDQNRNISTKLHITISTVEQHLTKIYRKLGVANRNELRARLEIGNGVRSD